MRLGTGVIGALVFSASAVAQGHILQGVGPINTSMGGAGVALPHDPQAALILNPALMSTTEGHEITLSAGFLSERPEIGTRLGTVDGSLDPTHEMRLIPAFGWVMRRPNSRLAFGAGVMETAGFHTDYQQDDGNLLTLPQPSGFGRIATHYQLTRIPVAFAFQATPQLSVGGSFNLYRARLSMIPLPFVASDTGPSGSSYLPWAASPVSRFGVGVQFGFFYEVNDTTAVAASYHSPSNFGAFQWNGTNNNPEVPGFGQNRLLELDFDAPSSFVFGVGLLLNERTKIAVDAQWTDFEGTQGLGGPGGVDTTNRRLEGFGWRNVWTFKGGIQYQLLEYVVVRGGYNQSQTPIREEIVVSSVGNPATDGQHFSVGAGVALYSGMSADVGLSFAPRSHVRGPLLDLRSGVVPDSELDLSNAATTLQFGLNFRF